MVIYTPLNSTKHDVKRRSKSTVSFLVFRIVLIAYCRKEFAEHGMADFVTVKHQNVCKAGFDLDGVVDAGAFMSNLYNTCQTDQLWAI